tara:strand:+ start:19568 stop:20230 length:663 start_codon:yes stop_codon:yes gene_type:complete
MKYKVGVSSRIIETEGYHEIRDAISHDLIKYLISKDLLPLIIPNNVNIAERYIEDINLLILSGGNSISKSPKLTKEEYTLSFLRDSVENILVKKAIEKNIPIIGICRGMQFINDFFGGTIKYLDTPHIHNSGEHNVNILNGDISFCDLKSVKVNSFHNYIVDELGKNLEAFATSNDDCIEAFRHNKLRIYGIMWHPERACSSKNFKNYNSHLIEEILANK